VFSSTDCPSDVGPRMWRTAPNFDNFKVEKTHSRTLEESASKAGLEYTFKQLVGIYGRKLARVYRDKMIQAGKTTTCEVTGAPLFPRAELQTLSKAGTQKWAAQFV